MKTRKEMAMEKFLGGYNCAQSVFYGFYKDFSIDGNTALKIACGFGAGMGRKQEVCGAVTGGIMVIGLKHGRGENDDREVTLSAYAKVRELMDRFSGKHGTFICRQLLPGCDMSTEEGQKYFKDYDLHNKTCRFYVESVIEILEDIL